MNPDRIDIDVWLSRYPFPVFLETVHKRVAEFEGAHPEYRINVITSWWQDLPAEASAAALRGSPPTIASYYTIDGELTSMPLTLSTMLLYTNMTVLRAAGITEVPRTWADVEAACAAIAALPDGPEHGIAWPVDGKLFQHAMAQQGAEFADEHNGRTGRATTVDLTSPGMRAYVAWWHRLNQAGHFLYTGSMMDWAGTFDAFAQQRIAFRLSSSFDAKYSVQAAKDNGFELAVSPVPHNDAVPLAGSWIGGDSLFLADGLDDATRDGALAFMQYLNNPRAAAEWHQAYGSAPLTRASVDLLDAEGWFVEHPYFRVATDQLDLTDGPSTQALLGVFAHVQRTAMDAMADVLADGADPVARFTEATAHARQLLADYTTHTLDESQTSPYCLHVDS